MIQHLITRLAIPTCCLGWLLPSSAQDAPQSGLYQILAGTYRECCGLVGSDTVVPLPDATQAYIRLALDPQSGTTTLIFLGDDRQTVFSRVPCAPDGLIDFRFGYGFGYAGAVVFHVDPGPPPYNLYWNYTASNSPSVLRIDGTLGISAAGCADTPTQFGHSNVLAVLLPPPRLNLAGFSTEHALRLMVQGRAGHTNVIEASLDLIDWVPVSTNLMDYSTCPICPYAIFEDIQSTNLARRFYRAYEL